VLGVGALCAACSQWCPRRTTLVVPFHVDLAVYHLMFLTAVAAIHIRACGRFREVSVRPIEVHDLATFHLQRKCMLVNQTHWLNQAPLQGSLIRA